MKGDNCICDDTFYFNESSCIPCTNLRCKTCENISEDCCKFFSFSTISTHTHMLNQIAYTLIARTEI